MAADGSILLVEDEALIRMLLEETLADEGFEVLSAADGKHAVAELESDATRFQAVVTDIRLGRGPDGWEVARLARGEVPEMPVLYVSGDSAHEWKARGVPHSLMVAKPFIGSEVVQALTKLLEDKDHD